MRAKLVADGFREANHGKLARRISRIADKTKNAGQRRDVRDQATVPAFERRNHRQAAPHRAEVIDLDCLLKRVGGHLVDVIGPGNACAVNQDVDRTRFVMRAENRLDLPAITHVDRTGFPDGAAES